MRTYRQLTLLAGLIAVHAGIAPARAEGSDWPDPGWRETLSRVDVTYDRSGLSTTINDFQFKALDEDGARAIAVRAFAYDSAFEELSLDDLATVKADGTVIPVDPRAVKDQPASADVTSPYFDQNRFGVVAFPNVAAGDSVRGRLRIKGKRARFPGAFATYWSQAADAPPGTLDLTVTGPADMPLHVAAHGVLDAVEIRERVIVHHVVFTETAPRRRRTVTDPFDDGRRFEASTYPDYAAFAADVAARNAPMAVPEAAVARLAASLTAGAATDRERAERIHNWVAANIRYVGIGLDDGGWTSQPAGAVLAAGYGDCKAHAVLLKALLAAQGIAADLVLVNAGPRYTLTDVATPNFDHAIVYVPEFDLYLDPTTREVAFGSLPGTLYGKPVLDVDRGRLASIPVMKPADVVLAAETDYALLPDGTRRATSRFSGSGLGAALGRSVAEWLATKDRSALAAHRLTNAGLEGTGTYDVPDPHRLSSSFSFAAPFTITRAFDLTSPFSLRMLALTDPRPDLGTLVTSGVQDGEFSCSAIDASSVASLALPDGINLNQKPADVHLVDEFAGTTGLGPVTGRIALDGKAWLDGRTVRSRSRITVAFSGPVCPESFLRHVHDALDRLDNFERVGGIGLTPFEVSFVTDVGSPFAAGLEAYEARHYDKALMIWVPLAEAGQADAQNRVGDLFASGLGVKQDLGEAFRWYLQAAAQGNALGQSHLGYCYETGLGVPRDDRKAAIWLARAAAQGYAYAEYDLARMHVDGRVKPSDLALAVSLLERAVAHGDADAEAYLGWLYRTGKGVPRDYARALERFNHAAAKGVAFADEELGALYARGEGVERDYHAAAIHLRRAADKGSVLAEYELGWLYENGFGVPASSADAMVWYARAANAGHADAQVRLDLLREQANPGFWSWTFQLIANLGR